MNKHQKNLKIARGKIEAILREHGIAGFAVLHGPGWGEVFWHLEPPYSVLKGEFPEFRLKSLVADYQGDTARQVQDQAQTAQMVHHITESMRRYFPQFAELTRWVDTQVGAEHVDQGFFPDANTPPGQVH
jgi:hypothetical protein